jgi:hypothetical protein
MMGGFLHELCGAKEICGGGLLARLHNTSEMACRLDYVEHLRS